MMDGLENWKIYCLNQKNYGTPAPLEHRAGGGAIIPMGPWESTPLFGAYY